MLFRQTRQQPSSMGLVATADAHDDEDGDSSGDGHSGGLFSAGRQRVLRRRSCLFMFEEVLSPAGQGKKCACYNSSQLIFPVKDGSQESAAVPSVAHHRITRIFLTKTHRTSCNLILNHLPGERDLRIMSHCWLTAGMGRRRIRESSAGGQDAAGIEIKK